jgi:hypothetical protein
LPVLALVIGAGAVSPPGQEGLRWITILAEQKLSGPSEGDSQRWAYLLGTAEIVASRPLGVGYSGFFDAMTATDVYRSGMAAEEESVVDANPHSSFLWYTSAGGAPGGLLALLAFTFLLNSMRVGLNDALGRPGFAFFVLIALPYLVIGLTVPYIFNSNILIAPAAIAAGWGWTERGLRRRATASSTGSSLVRVAAGPAF